MAISGTVKTKLVDLYSTDYKNMIIRVDFKKELQQMDMKNFCESSKLISLIKSQPVTKIPKFMSRFDFE